MVSFKRKKNSLPIFFLSSNDTLFRFLLPIPNSEFGCYNNLFLHHVGSCLIVHAK
jgi:hypothetical protein